MSAAPEAPRVPRVYPILDTPSLLSRGCEDWTMVARAMLAGGASILQMRHKGEWTRSVFESASLIARACDEAGARFIVNDRADYARLLNIGVHVGQDDLTPADCRAVLGPDAWVGFSTHNPDQFSARDADPATYLAFGPIFATRSKQNPDPVAGLALLARARAAVSKPLVAIGGVTRETALSVFAAGADSVALIADLLPDTLTEPAIRQRMEEWQRLVRN